MHKFIEKTIKATIINLIVALLIIGGILFSVDFFFGARIEEAVSIVNKVAIDVENKEVKQTILDEKKKIKNYPEYGTQYGTIEIPKIDINLPLYFGETLEILKKGVGHSSSSYFPGEGGSIVCMGHNSQKVFRRFSELEIGDEITIKATYGEYTYKIYDMKIVNEEEIKKLPVQKEKEILMVYTCYPFRNIGYTNRRYVVYSELIS